MADRNFVVAKIEHTVMHPRLGAEETIPVDLVIREGFPDFESESVFNGTNELQITQNTILSPRIKSQDWYYNSSTEEFQESAP